MTSSKWWDTSWNPIRGCTEISEGCENCYSKTFAERWGHYWGPPKLYPEKLTDPLHWRKPRRVFVESVADLFHVDVSTHWIDAIIEVISQCDQHEFMVLTKRAERMSLYIRDRRVWMGNLWLGVTAENQARADERIPHLLQTPAAKRFVSVEPMLGPVNMRTGVYEMSGGTSLDGIGWVIAGPETGPGKRPCDPAWIRDLYDQCKAAGVPFWDKSREPIAREAC